MITFVNKGYKYVYKFILEIWIYRTYTENTQEE